MEDSEELWSREERERGRTRAVDYAGLARTWASVRACGTGRDAEGAEVEVEVADEIRVDTRGLGPSCPSRLRTPIPLRPARLGAARCTHEGGCHDGVDGNPASPLGYPFETHARSQRDWQAHRICREPR